MKLRVLMFQSGGTFSLFFLIHLGLMVVTIYNTLNYWELGDSSKFPFTTVEISELVLVFRDWVNIIY